LYAVQRSLEQEPTAVKTFWEAHSRFIPDPVADSLQNTCDSLAGLREKVTLLRERLSLDAEDRKIASMEQSALMAQRNSEALRRLLLVATIYIPIVLFVVWFVLFLALQLGSSFWFASLFALAIVIIAGGVVYTILRRQVQS